MTINKIKLFSLVLMAAWLLPSCSEDNSLNDVAADEFRNGRGGNNNGGGIRGGNNNERDCLPVDALDNDILSDWTSTLLEMEQHASGMRPNASARALAYIYLTAYETAVPGMKRNESNSSRLEGLDIEDAPETCGVDYELAINTALATAIDHFLLNLPTEERNKISALETEKETDLSQDLSDEIIDRSKEWGQYVAEEIIEYSETDEAAEEQITEPQPLSYEPPTGAGYWTYSADPERALFPYWGSVRTFIISADETTTVEPLEYSEDTDSPYFQQMQEVLEVNNTAREQQNDQLHIAEFWSDDVEGLMISPPARQVSISNQLLDKYNLDLEESLELLLKVGFSLNDAAVSTWKYKYQHMVMRPSNFIHEFIDTEFQTNLYRLIYWPNPSFPGYPSGHSCFASAAAGIFIETFGDRTNFTDRTHEGRTEFLGEPRTFRRFSDMADENGYSRIPLGVHVRMDCEEGLRLGYEIADAVNEINFARPI